MICCAFLSFLTTTLTFFDIKDESIGANFAAGTHTFASVLVEDKSIVTFRAIGTNTLAIDVIVNESFGASWFRNFDTFAEKLIKHEAFLAFGQTWIAIP